MTAREQFEKWWATVDANESHRRAMNQGTVESYTLFMRMARVFAEAAWMAAPEWANQQKPGAAGEQQPTEEPPIHFVGVICGSRAQRSSVYREHVTCPDCLKLMRDGTGKEPQPPAPPAAPEPGKSVNILSYQIVQDVLEREGLAVLIERFGKAISAERAAAAGEARRKALDEAIALCEAKKPHGGLTTDGVAEELRSRIDAAAAPAGEGSKA